jgi:hypothetical protein
MTNMSYKSHMTYGKFVKRWEKVVELPPQTFGPFTKQYKWLAGRVKIMPWPVFLLLSIMMVVILYGVFGTAIAYIVTLLQKGF